MKAHAPRRARKRPAMSYNHPGVLESENAAEYLVTNLRYVLITPARNEAAFIELTLQSVVRQTILPEKWIIVSNGSTDKTDEIVSRYAEQYKWLMLIRVPDFPERTFAAKVAAFNIGYATVVNEDFDIIANLDADLSF